MAENGPTPEERAAWKRASEQLQAIEAWRRQRLEPTDAAHQSALEAMALAEERIGEPICVCEACAEPVFEGEPWLAGETPLCGTCAPTYADLLREPELFVNSEDGVMAADEAKAIYDDHIASGGMPSDSMATPDRNTIAAPSHA